MAKCCNECVFYKQKQEKFSCGTCDYPVPEWLKIGALGGGFISNEEYSGVKCSTFKSRADLIDEVAETPTD